MLVLSNDKRNEPRNCSVPSAAQIESMVRKIRRTFIRNLREYDWMDGQTGVRAIRKARAIQDKLVAPDWIEDRDQLDLFYAEVSPTLLSSLSKVVGLRLHHAYCLF